MQRIALDSTFSADAGGLKNVSLMTTGIEAAGHGIYLDDKTAEGVMKKLLGRSVKSYLRHDGAFSDRLGNEIGFFSGIYRQGAQIKATAFEFLESFKKDSGVIADKLIEMAAKVPDQFGVSLVLEYAPVWVMGDGSEVPARGDTPPQGALRNVPTMRVLDVISADFVGRPAANPNGLLSADAAETPKENKTMSDESKPAEVKPETTVASLSVTDHEAQILALSNEHKAALEMKAGEVAALTAALAAKDAEHKAALEKAVADAVAPLNKQIGELAMFDARKLGVAPVALHVAVAKHHEAAGELPAPAKTDREKWEQYAELAAKSPELAAKFKAAHLGR